MDTAVIVAIVTAVASLVVAVTNSVLARRRDVRLATLEHELRAAESAEATLERYRGPLLAAAFDLQDRLDNIVNPERDLLAGYGGRRNPRRDEAVKTTLYRIGQYLCWVEIVRRDRQFLTFQEPEDTRAVADLLGRVGRILADDRYGQEFMLWREEQRAIGERMIEEGDLTTCVGYATFVESYPQTYARWFDRFGGTLSREAAMTSTRLHDLRDALRLLVELLDPDQLRFRRSWSRAPEARA